MSTLQRTPPNNNTITNSSKRVRSDDAASEDTQTLTLDAVMTTMNKQFTKTLARIEKININISGKIDTVKAELDGKLETVLNDISIFKAYCTARIKCNEDALCDLNGRIDEISQEVSSLENRNELIMSGIPYLKEENLTSYFNAMWKHVGLHEGRTPSVDLRRLRSNTQTTPRTTQTDGLILLQFALRNNRDDFFNSYLQKLDLKLCHLRINSNRRVYVNENLTVAARKIKAAALRLKKAGKLSSVYTKLGIVMMKRSADQPPVAVHSEASFDQFS